MLWALISKNEKLGRIHVKKMGGPNPSRPFWTENMVPGRFPERPRGPQNGFKIAQEEVQDAIPTKNSENVKNDNPEKLGFEGRTT